MTLAYYTEADVQGLARENGALRADVAAYERTNAELRADVMRLTDALRAAHDDRPRRMAPRAHVAAGATRTAPRKRGAWKYRMSDDAAAGFVAADYYGRAWIAPTARPSTLGATSTYTPPADPDAYAAALADWRVAHHTYAMAVRESGADSGAAHAADDAAAAVKERMQRAIRSVGAA